MTHVSGSKTPGTDIKFIAPDGGWGWVIVFSSFIIHLIMDGITYSLGTYLTVFTEYFHVSHGAASIIHSLLPAVTLSSGPLASMFTNRFGCRTTTIIGTFIASFGFIISFFVKKFYYLYFTIGIVVGIGFGLIYVPAIVSVGYYFEKRRSLAIGIAVCGTGVGTFLLSPANRILMEQYGWQGAFLLKAAIILNGIACALVMRPVPIEPSEILKNSKKSKKSHDTINEPESDFLLTQNLEKTTPKIHVSNSNHMMKFENKEDLEIDLNQFAKSLPHLNKDIINNNNSSKSNNSKSTNLAIKQSQLSIKNFYSSMDIMAHTRSLQNVQSLKTLDILNDKNGLNDKIDETKPKGCMEKINQFIDFSIFLDFIFVYFAISNFLTSLGFNAPFIFIVDQAISLKIPEKSADWLLSTIGISNTVGRIILGLIADIKGVNRLYLYSSVLTICGIATIVEPFFTNFTGLLIYSIVFGFTSGGYVSITSILLVDLLGLEKLTNAFGILLLIQGIATAIGPPTVGFMYSYQQSYVFPFIFTGTMIAISGFMCFFIPCFRCYKKPTDSK